MRTSRLLVPLLLLLLTLTAPLVDGFPTSAGACPGGVAAVEGTAHTQQGKAVTTGSLSEGNLVVLLNGIALADVNDDNGGDSAASITVGVANTLEVTGGDFRGFLVRVGYDPNQPRASVDLRDSIAPSVNDTALLAQIATVTCVDVEQVGGLTHTSNVVKNSVLGSLLVDAPAQGISLDVTVVVQHDATTSTFYYSNFVINAIQEGGDKEKDDFDGGDLDSQVQPHDENTSDSAPTIDEPFDVDDTGMNANKTNTNATQLEPDADDPQDLSNTDGSVVVSATSGASHCRRHLCGAHNHMFLPGLVLAMTLVESLSR